MVYKEVCDTHMHWNAMWIGVGSLEEWILYESLLRKFNFLCVVEHMSEESIENPRWLQVVDGSSWYIFVLRSMLHEWGYWDGVEATVGVRGIAWRPIPLLLPLMRLAKTWASLATHMCLHGNGSICDKWDTCILCLCPAVTVSGDCMPMHFPHARVCYFKLGTLIRVTAGTLLYTSPKWGN